MKDDLKELWSVLIWGIGDKYGYLASPSWFAWRI